MPHKPLPFAQTTKLIMTEIFKIIPKMGPGYQRELFTHNIRASFRVMVPTFRTEQNIVVCTHPHMKGLKYGIGEMTTIY